MVTQLLEAIADVKMWQIADKHIVILAPPNTLECLVQEELTNGEGEIWQRLAQPTWGGYCASRFNDILFIEDESLTQIVVKSLISDHRAVVQL